MFESRETHLEVHKLIAQCTRNFLEKHNISNTVCSIRDNGLTVQQMRFGRWQSEANEQTQEQREVLYYHYRVFLNENSDDGDIPEIDW